MVKQATISKLREIRLSAMAEAFENQCANPEHFEGLSFEDRFGMLVDKEWEKRRNTRLDKLVRHAEFRYPNACIEDIEYHADRNLNKCEIIALSTCRYITDSHHIIIKGASGNGKTYIACALGIAACRNFIKVRYIRLPDLLNCYRPPIMSSNRHCILSRRQQFCQGKCTRFWKVSPATAAQTRNAHGKTNAINPSFGHAVTKNRKRHRSDSNFGMMPSVFLSIKMI